MKYQVQFKSEELAGTFELPVSKSHLNRFLILRALSNNTLPEIDPSWPSDIILLLNALEDKEKIIDVQDAGTAMRFATAFFSVRSGEFEIRGTERMHQRPIGVLVDALNELGADISYLAEIGFPPLKISGKQLTGGKVKVQANISSQFVSALLMIAPVCENSVEIELAGEEVSKSYTDLTLSLMKKCGVEVSRTENGFRIKSQKILIPELPFEKDWSAASFVYSLSACSEKADVFIPGLKVNDLQGDKILVEWFQKLGVYSKFEDGGLRISTISEFQYPSLLEFDFTSNPDLVQPMVFCCLARNIELSLKGLFNLHLKETDRLEAIRYNVEAVGGKFIIEMNSAKMIPGEKLYQNSPFKVFGDHRMAMSLVSLSSVLGKIEIPEIEVVEKSFPNFWNELKKLGLEIN